MRYLFNKELLLRIISVFIYIPIVILPLVYSNYVAVITYLIFTSVVLTEIIEMKKNVTKSFFFNFYAFIAISSFFLFLLLLITGKVAVFYLLIIIIIIWTFDTFSYLGGKTIGGVKLFPKISPGKTLSGLISGILMTLLFTQSIELFFITSYVSLFFSLLIILLSFLGDTVVSLLKRYATLKDTGAIMPGHGGLLDRFDSFIMVFFFLGIIHLMI